MLFVGIDPGKKGGVSFISRTGASQSLPMPDIQSLLVVLDVWQKGHGVAHCFLEHAQAMPKQGVTSMFNYGSHFGQLQGLLIALRIPFTLIKPKDWQKELFKGTVVKCKPKARALQAAKRLFPKEKFLASTRCTTPHDGMIDSLLIAEFCRRKIL